MPPSASAHKLFRGFSFVDPTLLEDMEKQSAAVAANNITNATKENVRNAL